MRGGCDALQAEPQTVQVPAEGARQMDALAFRANSAWLFVASEQGAPNSLRTVLPLPAGGSAGH